MRKSNLLSTISYVPYKAFNGYTLFAPISGFRAWLIDMQGRFVHCWKLPYRPACHTRLLSNGNLLAAGKVMDMPLAKKMEGAGGALVEYDWEGKEVSRYEDPYQHHDFYPLANGNFMILRWEKVPDNLAKYVKGGVPHTEFEGTIIFADSFHEVDRQGNVVWEWYSHEHLDLEKDIICPLCHRSELTHCNSCYELPDGNIITTALALDCIIIIDKKSGDIKWQWGKGELAHPHDPTLLDNGNILVFDNGLHRKTSYPSWSRVLEVNPKTGEIVWEYKDRNPGNFFASFISGCQRLPNGNTLICDGPHGYFFEITTNGEIVWEYVNPFFGLVPLFNVGYSNFTFRAHRISPDYEALKGKELDPKRFESINRIYGPEVFR